MNVQSARQSGQILAAQVAAGRIEEAHAGLASILAGRTPFRLLDILGSAIGQAPAGPVDLFLQRIAAQGTMGGWVVIAAALAKRIPGDLSGALGLSRDYVVHAGVWYATDIFGERVPGPALVACFDQALPLLAGWRVDPNRWVRRSTGVAVHFWAKRAHGAPQCLPQARALLDFLAPMFSETDLDAVKGAGWGLKTLGRYYPEPVTDFLLEARERPHRALMLRKAMAFLPPAQKARLRPITE
jgi:hypothetical protein